MHPVAANLRTVLLGALVAPLMVACGGQGGAQDPNLPSPPPSEAPADLTPPENGDQPPVRIIYDTDFGMDVDDVGALAVLHKLADQNEAALLAVVSNVSDPYAPAAIDVINTYYGRPDVPVGLTTSPYYAEAYPYWRDPSPRYIQTLVERFPHDTPIDVKAVPSAIDTYRKLLSKQPDGSVSIISVGFMQNLSGLLASSPDVYSSLSGRALIEQKVKELVIMGGHYPSSDEDLYLTGGREMGPSYAIEVINNWPTKTVFNTGPMCHEVTNGQTLAADAPDNSPVRAAYTLFFEEAGRGRNSWDLCSVLYTVRGLKGPEGEYFRLSTDEHLVLEESGHNAWVAPGNGRHERLVRVMDVQALQKLFEKLLIALPLD